MWEERAAQKDQDPSRFRDSGGQVFLVRGSWMALQTDRQTHDFLLSSPTFLSSLHNSNPFCRCSHNPSVPFLSPLFFHSAFRPKEVHLLSGLIHLISRWKWSPSVVSDSCDPMNWGPPGVSVHGIFQARILEWVALSFSRRSSRPRDWTLVLLHCRQTLYRLSHQGSPQ